MEKVCPKGQDKLAMSQIINKYKAVYQKLKPIYSSALGEDVRFNASGFKHLVFKDNHRRPNKVIYSRMVLVPLIKPVIYKCSEVSEVRKAIEKVGDSELEVEYRALEAKIGKNPVKVRVVVKKIGKNGKYYFQSIMKV